MFRVHLCNLVEDALDAFRCFFCYLPKHCLIKAFTKLSQLQAKCYAEANLLFCHILTESYITIITRWQITYRKLRLLNIIKQCDIIYVSIKQPYENLNYRAYYGLPRCTVSPAFFLYFADTDLRKARKCTRPPAVRITGDFILRFYKHVPFQSLLTNSYHPRILCLSTAVWK